MIGNQLSAGAARGIRTPDPVITNDGRENTAEGKHLGLPRNVLETDRNSKDVRAPRCSNDVEWMRALFDYNPLTGALLWRETPLRSKRSNTKSANKPAGSLNDQGYIVISVSKVRYKAHRIAWLLVHGVWPSEIDHINGVRNDNRIVNLREVDRSQNMANRVSLPHTATAKGVHFRGGSKPWRAQIRTRGKCVSLGHFSTEMEAQAAYEKAAERICGNFALHCREGVRPRGEAGDPPDAARVAALSIAQVPA